MCTHRRHFWLGLVLSLSVFAGLPHRVARAEGDGDADEEEGQVTEKDLKDAKVPLQDALKAAETQGKPISAKYELEKGKLQLSVYAAKGDKYSELIVDHKTGKVVKAEPITGGDDLKAAQEQNAAMGKAKNSLRAAIGKALADNKGFRAVSATASLDGDHPVARITLIKGTESHQVTQKLD
jgi:peptidase YpeB-like protein